MEKTRQRNVKAPAPLATPQVLFAWLSVLKVLLVKTGFVWVHAKLLVIQQMSKPTPASATAPTPPMLPVESASRSVPTAPTLTPTPTSALLPAPTDSMLTQQPTPAPSSAPRATTKIPR